MKLKHIFTGIIAVAALVACDNIFETPIVDPLITTDGASFTIPAEGGTAYIAIKSNMPWEIKVTPANKKSDVSDFVVYPISGKASLQPVIVEVKAPSNDGGKRTAILSIIGPQGEASVQVVQPSAGGEATEKGTTVYSAYKPSEIYNAILAGDVPTDEVYVKGIIYKISELSTSYGNATYWISDDGAEGTEVFEIYRGYDLGGEKFTDENAIKVGDSIVAYGKAVNYNGTPEFTTGSKLITINGRALPSGDGTTAESPMNVTKALDLIWGGQIPTGDAYVVGTISSIVEVSTGYGNATYWISDDGTDAYQLEVYRGYWLEGEKFTDTEQIKEGDQVVVMGKLVLYTSSSTGVSTPEFTTGSRIISINGESE